MKIHLKLQLNYDWFNNTNHHKNKYPHSNCLKILLLLLLVSSCYSSKNIDYLQSPAKTYTKQVHPTTYEIQPFDILNIKVQSRDPEQSAFFNISSIENRNIDANPASLFLNGYTVSEEGTVNMAIVGKVKVVGLTVEEIRDIIQIEIDKQLLNAKVLVSLTSFKISVLGDVQNPGTNYVYNAQSTLFEALSAAGDLNLSAKRHNIKLIRQIGKESLVVNLDLTDPNIIESPYYFLYPNDVIYVETSKQNILRSNLGLFTTFLSAVSTGLLVLNFISNQ